MDPATIERLAVEHPERYRGGIIDRTRHQGITETEALRRAARCLDDDNEPRAAYWAGFAGSTPGMARDLTRLRAGRERSRSGHGPCRRTR